MPDIPPFVTHLKTEQLPTAQGRSMPIRSQIPESFAWVLHRTVLHLRPASAVEVGLATGTSALAMLSAMEVLGHGRLVSIDPNQSTNWQGCAEVAVANAGLAHRHTIIEKPDYLALPHLVEEGARVQFAYVDGWHTFDYVALDAFFIDKMMDVGGIIAFNDCSWPAVRKAIAYLATHRRYQELDTGLPKYRGRNASRTAARFLMRRTSSDRYLRKLDDWEPPFTFFRRF